MNIAVLVSSIKGATPFEIIVSVALFIIFSGGGFATFSFRRSIKRTTKILRIKFIETLYEQMTKTEIANASILFKLRKVYNTACTDEACRNTYRRIIHLTEKEIKSIQRKWAKENHLLSYSDKDFREYKKDKIKFMLDLTAESFDDEYKPCKSNITREELRELNEKLVVPFAVETWDKMFDDWREISLEKQQIIKKLEGKLGDITN